MIGGGGAAGIAPRLAGQLQADPDTHDERHGPEPDGVAPPRAHGSAMVGDVDTAMGFDPSEFLTDSTTAPASQRTARCASSIVAIDKEIETPGIFFPA